MDVNTKLEEMKEEYFVETTRVRSGMIKITLMNKYINEVYTMFGKTVNEVVNNAYECVALYI